MRQHRPEDPRADLDDDERREELDLDVAPQLAPGRRPMVMRDARSGRARPGARAAIERAAQGQGQPLPDAVRARLERALAADLSAVRVHTDRAAAEAADAIAANAFTLGQDVYFAAGLYDPSSHFGFRLLAHEVAHTVQQGPAPQSLDGLVVSEPGDDLEVEADRVADAVAAEPDATDVADVADTIRPRRDHDDPTQDRLDASEAAMRGGAAGVLPLGLAGGGAIAQRTGDGGDGGDGGDAQSGDAPTLKWSTDFSAPSGGKDNRFTVGPGEKMTFTGSAKGTWTATDGDPSSGDENDTFDWTAPNNVGIYTIKLTVDGKDVSQGISVLAPTKVTFTNKGEAGSFGDTQAGVGMVLDMKIGPDNASFGAIQIQEKPGGAASATGVFAKEDAAHKPNEDWTNIRESNASGSYDDAWAGPYEQPVEMGKLVWNIPYYWQPSSGSGGTSFAIVLQTMEVVDSKGTMTIIKGNASQSRTPKPKPKPAAAAGGNQAAGPGGGNPAAGNGGDQAAGNNGGDSQ